MAARLSLLEKRLTQAREQASLRTRDIAQRDAHRHALEKTLRDTDVLLSEFAERNRILHTTDAASQRLALDRSAGTTAIVRRELDEAG